MAAKGVQVATPPVPKWPNILVHERVGQNANGDTTWRVSCGCGHYAAVARRPAIRRGFARCPVCNPTHSAQIAEEIQQISKLLPAGYAKLIRAMKLPRLTVETRIEFMRKVGMCHVGGWQRPEAQGAIGPVFHPGAGDDVPCTLEAIPKNKVRQNYSRRVRKAINKAAATGTIDPRYVKHIRLKQANETVRKARSEPHNPFSALGL